MGISIFEVNNGISDKQFKALMDKLNKIDIEVTSYYNTLNSKIDNLQWSLSQLLKSHPKLIFSTIINNQTIQILSMSLEVKQFMDTALTVVDKATGNAINAVISNVVLTSSDEAIFTCNTDVNADGTLDVVGISVGEASLHVTADVSYTDANTGLAVTANLAADAPVSVTAPPPTAQTPELVVSFTTPAPVV